MRKLALFGYSGHAYVVADAISACGDQLVGYYEKEEAQVNPFGIPYLGYEQDRDNLRLLKEQGVPGIVGVGECSIREKVMSFLKNQGVALAQVIHPSAIVSGLTEIGEGTFVAAGVKVNALAAVGAGVILNTGCIVEHECRIGDFAHIAPGAVLAGNVTVGEGSFIGANAVVKQGVRIGSNVLIGAGAVVLKDVPDDQTWVGNPAKEIVK
ncbi:sugar O-acyltransferase (sialic acid O-acetyltransferase NeuD family) [Pontibacter ummariensis]|uniref:Sugar O-acyltransferase, sialic acid O-acetyltransferase NeuD family n=1 Tax=Pontibacter ummariensis TaxID=1610492 RepID=A0A239EKC6_9BACT|nr:acetyltransferase [Pontibacter ummariensis]PRY13291.1 sugar O-acyltransferase (sialic acid O-acetyltransferase NeuD family) [Pontibacter ummariensis]SNS44738.1 sugar O-acyltransferase, sialic acid O-acetyltransferase NeuD family [Pontibacter ummariensis]